MSHQEVDDEISNYIYRQASNNHDKLFASVFHPEELIPWRYLIGTI